MARMYAVTFSALSLSGNAKDILEIIAAAGKPIRVHSALFTMADSETNEQLSIEARIATGSYTSGSGGTAVTPAKLSSTLPAASFSAEKGNSSNAASGSGALTAVHTEGIPSQGGYAWVPTPDMIPILHGGEAMVWHFVTGPAAATTINGTVYVEEL
jgi:hypothetical protein